MGVIRQDYGSAISGAPALSQLLYNANKTLLGSITTYDGSYTATQDCVMYGYAKGASNGSVSPIIYLNDEPSMFANSSSSGLWQLYIGYSTSANTDPDTYGVFIPKGTTVKTRNQSGQTYNLKFYTLE